MFNGNSKRPERASRRQPRSALANSKPVVGRRGTARRTVYGIDCAGMSYNGCRAAVMTSSPHDVD